jgi:glutathionyl-hydroquinone reductase
MMYELLEFKKVKDRIDKTVYEYCVDGKNWSFLKLKKGCIAGEHYHKGISRLKNPEILIALEGKFRFLFKDLHTGKDQRIVVNAPKIIKILPFVYHEMEILEDTILLERYDEGSIKDRFEIKP